MAAYNRTQSVVDSQLKRFDDYARLTEKFVEKMVGYDYLEKRVKRVYINE